MSASERLLKGLSAIVVYGLCADEFDGLEERLDAMLSDLPESERKSALEKAWLTVITATRPGTEPASFLVPMGYDKQVILDEILHRAGADDCHRSEAERDAITRRAYSLDLSGDRMDAPNGWSIQVARRSCADELAQCGVRAWFGQRLAKGSEDRIEPEDISELVADAVNSRDYRPTANRLDEMPEAEAKKLLRKAWITCATISWDGREPDSALALPMDADRTEVRTELFKMLRDASEGAGADWEAAREGIWSLDLSEDRMEGPDGRTLEVWRMSCADVLKEQGIERPYLGDAQAPGPRM